MTVLAQTPLTLFKAQLNITHDLDNELLNHKLVAAEAWIERNTGRQFYPEMAEAALMLAAFWYEQREAASFGLTTKPIPFGVHELLASWREAVVGHVTQ